MKIDPWQVPLISDRFLLLLLQNLADSILADSSLILANLQESANFISCGNYQSKIVTFFTQTPHLGTYSHLSNNRGGWNKRGGSAKVAKSINVEVGINVEGGILWKKLMHNSKINEEWRVEKI